MGEVVLPTNIIIYQKMAPAMKTMKASGPVMTKDELDDALATQNELKKSQSSKMLDTLATISASELKKAGKFTIPGVCMVKTRVKPATKAGKREIFGKMQIVKAKPARTVIKAFPVAALKNSI